MDQILLPDGTFIYWSGVKNLEQALDYLNLYVLMRDASEQDGYTWKAEAADAMAEAYVARWGR